MKAGELLTSVYDLEAMTTEAQRHADVEAAVTEAVNLFPEIGVETRITRGIVDMGESLVRRVTGGDSLMVHAQMPALVSSPYESFGHDNMTLDSRLVYEEIHRWRTGAKRRLADVALLLTGITHKSQRTVVAQNYRWAVLHAPGADSKLLSLSSTTEENLMPSKTPCSIEEENALAAELRRAVNSLQSA